MRWFALTVLMLTPALSHARPPGPPHGPPPLAMVVMHHADEIGIDANTQARIKDTMKAARSTIRSLHDDVRAAHDALRTALEAEVVDEGAVFDASAALADADLALRNRHLEVDLAVLAELTPTQRRVLKEQRPAPGERPPRH